MNELPKRPYTHVLEDLSRLHVFKCMSEWIVRDVSLDYGLDQNVEIVKDGKVTGKNFSIQLKATQKPILPKRSPSVSVKSSTFEYMSSRPEPVMIVLYSATDDIALWVWRHECKSKESKDRKRVHIYFKNDQQLEPTKKNRISQDVSNFLSTKTRVDRNTASKIERFGRYRIDLSRQGVIFKEEVDHFEHMINNPKTTEMSIQLFIEAHPEILLGGEYTQLHAQLRLQGVGLSLIPDFFVESVTGLCDILEIKRPNQRIMLNRGRRKTFSVNIHEGVAQVREYSEFFEDSTQRNWFKRKFDLSVFRPLTMLLVGRDSEFSDPIERRRLESYLGRVRILTYDDLIRIARSRQID